MKHRSRIFGGFVIAGWLVPMFVLAWFAFFSRPADSEDYGWAIGGFLSFTVSLALASLLLGVGTVGLIHLRATHGPNRALISAGAIGFCLVALALLSVLNSWSVE